MHISEDLAWNHNTATPTTPVLPPQTEESKSPTFRHEHLLHWCHREHPDLLRHRVVRSLHRVILEPLRHNASTAERIIAVSLTTLSDTLVLPGKPSGLQVTHSTNLKATSACCHQGGDCSLRARNSRFKDSYLHQTMRRLNSLPSTASSAPSLAYYKHRLKNTDCTPSLQHLNIAYPIFYTFLIFCITTHCLTYLFCTIGTFVLYSVL